MIDLHSHVLHNIDDGSTSIEESRDIVINAINAGITDIFVTPHFIKDSIYDVKLTERTIKFNQLKAYVSDLNINLHLANEVYLDEGLDYEELSFLSTKYLLMELPVRNKINNLTEIIFNLNVKGIKVVIAHPERYEYVQSDIHYLDPLIEMGVIFQGNVGSLFGYYGNNVKKTMYKLIDGCYIQLLGSDCHRRTHNTYKYYNDLKNVLSSEAINVLTVLNPSKILNNEEVVPIKYEIKKRGLFSLPR